MAPNSFRTRIEKLRPASATLRPGVVLVAILKPDVLPEDDITADNVFWAKCSVTRNIGVLADAFRRNEKRPTKLIQGSRVLDEVEPMSSVEVEDELCILEAVLEIELTSRLPRQRLTSSTQPLCNITYNAVNHDPLSVNSEPKLKSSPMPVGFLINPDSTTPLPDSASGHAGGNATSLDTSDIKRAWIDFLYERREFTTHRTQPGPQRALSRIDFDIIQEWQTLTPYQRRFFVDRIRGRSFRSDIDHRTFWIYYYDNYEKELSKVPRNEPHTSVDSTMAFYDRVTFQWRHLGSSELSGYHDRLSREHHTTLLPDLPSGSSLPPPQAAHEPTPNDTGRVNLSQHKSAYQQPVESQSSRMDLAALFESQSIEQLESGVAHGLDMLRSIKENIRTESSGEGKHWLESIANIEKQAEKTKTVIGVVGATGAGKSSIINALLDEERLVPTNCMRACTAVVTEISYNYEDDLYRADIAFISRAEWLKELKTSFEDLFDSNGKVSWESANEDSEAGIAYAKIKAVYPLLTKEMMENTSVDQLMNHQNVKNLLGSSRSIENDNSLSFYKILQQYVDSKEKTFSRGKKTVAEKAKAQEMEYWPLIRVVRLQVKAPSLSTGAVIVDLPGVHDSNQARAAVAQGYLKQCTGLWIVAPITRAVDDKSAKTLLGDTFKRQLKMDGGYNSVTFICSKTDDISITEAQDSLGLDEELAPLYTRGEDLRKKSKSLKDQIEKLKEDKTDVSAAIDSADELLETWEKLRQDLEDGKTVYLPKEKQSSNKRKRESSNSGSRKKSRYAEDGDDAFVADDISDDGSDREEETVEEDRGEPLTEDVINDKISELKASKKEGRLQRTALEDEIRALRAQKAEVATEQDDIDGKLSGKCIKGRNEYSRGAIQQDFASGIRELDQEIAEEEDAANFNPETDTRDYDAVAKSLPVFCVSSRGYQKLMGRLQKDKGLPSFQNADETEMPALQAHCQSLTVKNREAACKRFLNNLSHILNSLRLWCSDDGSGINLSDAQLRREAEILNSRLSNLNTEFEATAKATCNSIKDELEDHLYDRFEPACETAKNEAINIQAKWGAPVNRQNRSQGGLYWPTYKATVRRDGTYAENRFNDDLIEPVIKQVTTGWDKVFSRRVPQTLAGFSNSIHQLLVKFHNEVEKRAINNGSSIARFQMLQRQLPTYRGIASDASDAMKDLINTRQKDVNREFVPIIEEAMLPAYATTAAESEPGSFMRMKNAMREHIEWVKNYMFDDSVRHVRHLLQSMISKVEDNLMTRLDQIFLAVERDYQSVIIGRSLAAQTDPRVRREHRRVRQEILKIIDDAEAKMEQALKVPSSTKTADTDDFINEVQESNGTTANMVEEEPTNDSAESMNKYIGSNAVGKSNQLQDIAPMEKESGSIPTSDPVSPSRHASHSMAKTDAKQASRESTPDVSDIAYSEESNPSETNSASRPKPTICDADWNSSNNGDSDSDG